MLLKGIVSFSIKSRFILNFENRNKFLIQNWKLLSPLLQTYSLFGISHILHPLAILYANF